MRIRRLEIQGFKSFADRTSFEFGEGISSIVGPNGCGKSNVVDAIKWVLGDMSPKSLRGKRMEDVIFAGSRHRRALPLAEVTLVLDNESGLLRTERTEVSITRRLHRDGNGEYLIGGDRARLKDIRELFLDTGLGAEGNAIMEQGQIDALLAASPQDRRGLFEEAAGISRYKQRRKEAEQRLGRTDDNLERLLDVLELEEKRLRSLKNQAGRARRYQELRQELGRKRVLRAVLRYRGIADERDRMQESLTAALSEERTAAEEVRALEGRVREAESAREAAREEVHAEEARIAQASADARAARDRATWATRSRAELDERIEAARRQAVESRERRERLQREVAALDEEAGAAETRAGEHASRLAEADVELSRREGALASIRDAHEGVKREVLRALGGISEARNEEAERRAEVRQALDRLGRIGSQRVELAHRRVRVDAELADLYAQASRMEAETQQRTDALAAAEARRLEGRAAVDTARTRRTVLSEDLASRRARLEVLERLTASYEGVAEGARAVLEESGRRAEASDGSRDGVLGILADLLNPSPEGAALLDRVLGTSAGAVVVRRSEDALRWIQWLREHKENARARFLALDLVRDEPGDLPGDVGSLGCDEALERLVRSVASGTLLVDRLEEGLAAWRTQGTNAVTPTGDRVTASGGLLGGADGQSLGLVERHAEMRALKAQAERLADEAEEARRAAVAAEAGLHACEEEIERLRTDLQRRAEDRHEGSRTLARVEKERSHVEQGLAVIEAEREELDEIYHIGHEASAVAGRRVAGLEERRRELEERAEDAAREYLGAEDARHAAGERRMEVRLAVAEAKARAEAARGRVGRAREEIETLDERIESLEGEAKGLTERLTSAEVEITEAEALARRREGECKVAGEALVTARDGLLQLETTAGAEDGRREELQKLYEEVRRRLEEFRLKESELRVRMESLIEQVRQDQGLELDEVARESAPTEEVDFEAVDAEVEELRRRLENLGNVNLNAIAELDEVQEHVTFLQTQQKDLLDAKGDLEKVIRELDQLSTVRFAETFEKVRENFRETFRRLFGGGRAEIVLEDASNLLESGVDIIARPPGKEQRTISLLSGGERTLTAVALLFAVFQAKPSPFAILDEVDAALDEANVRRLIGLVREFTDRSQFLVVTHAKTTMEAADVLYGVTMEEPGVSKKVAVRLTDYPAEAVAAAG